MDRSSINQRRRVIEDDQKGEKSEPVAMVRVSQCLHVLLVCGIGPLAPILTDSLTDRPFAATIAGRKMEKNDD